MLKRPMLLYARTKTTLQYMEWVFLLCPSLLEYMHAVGLHIGTEICI